MNYADQGMMVARLSRVVMVMTGVSVKVMG